MKTKTTIMIWCLCFFFSSIALFSQNDTPERPMYVVATTLHWNMDLENFKMDEWMATEKEFLDKVVMKNEHIMGSGVYTHRYTPDNRELIYVQTFSSWDAIDKFNARNNELIKEAWPSEEERDAYFKKRNSYYADFHSDEIYATMGQAKVMTEAPTKDMILYVRKSHFDFKSDGSNEEFSDLHSQFVEHVINKNELIKGYYPNAHAWGADRREFIEAFVVSSMTDLDEMFNRSNELFMQHWDTEEKQKAYNEAMSKYFTGVHGDSIYTIIGELAKQ